MTDTNESKDALMEALAGRLMSGSDTPMNPHEWTNEQRTEFVQALAGPMASALDDWMDMAAEGALDGLVIPDADDIREEVKQGIMDDLDYSEIVGNIDTDELEFEFDYDAIANEVVESHLDSASLAEQIDVDDLDLSSMPLEDEIQRLVMHGCGVMDDAAQRLISRATDSDYYEEGDIRILTTAEYDALRPFMNLVQEDEEDTIHPRVESVLNFIESTFSIPEPEAEPEAEPEPEPAEIVAEFIKRGLKPADLMGVWMGVEADRLKELRRMQKPELQEAARQAGVDDQGTKTQILGRIMGE